jgi:bifunctional DNA-binding transcriptional regulator/antitoxin component of YhaV-PrlF toxin-antitoxin module
LVRRRDCGILAEIFRIRTERRVSSFRTRIEPSGRLVIPVAQRRELGLEIGDEVLLETAGDELRVSSLEHRIARVQALVRKYNGGGESLSDALIRERRAEAARG